MSESTLLLKLVAAIRGAAVHNPEVQAAPACILWPDRDRQWEAAIPRLLNELPELFVLGDYQPERRMGPAIWLRCVLAGQISVGCGEPLEKCGKAGFSQPPVFYLPGVGRQDLRAIESCPESLKPLAELQYRGAMWSQINAKDWTVLAFLCSGQGGLGLSVVQDQETKAAMQLALVPLLDEDLALLQSKPIDSAFFNQLLTGGDTIRDLLRWIDHPDSFRESAGDKGWKAFVALARSMLGFDPQKEGPLAAAVKLAVHSGPWQAVWDRFREAPKLYSGIPGLIRQCTPPHADMWADACAYEGWPQWNDAQEADLRSRLEALINEPAHKARQAIAELDEQHAGRRSTVWADLGEAPLAEAIGQLAVAAEMTAKALAGGGIADLAAAYGQSGWRADDAILRALGCLTTAADLAAVTAAVRAIYLPWLDESARHLQKVVQGSGYPVTTQALATAPKYAKSECILFVDGLRFDVAKRLAARLAAKGFGVTEEPVWSALPSVTATGKAAVSPVRSQMTGSYGISDFEPGVAEGSASQKGTYHFRKLLEQTGWTYLATSATDDGSGRAWCECGDIDSEGHQRGWKLAKHVDGILSEIEDRMASLAAAGRTTIRVVTDHGWLLVPGGLPKAELPSALTESKWGRCAAIKEGASSAAKLYPWSWNSEQHFALADGVSCYQTGEEYAHGGLSLQECLTLELLVAAAPAEEPAAVQITDLGWKGLRCTVAVDGTFQGLQVDVRRHAGDPSSSVVLSLKPVKDDGTASVVVEDEGREGQEACVVLLSESGTLVAQQTTTIGGGAG